MDLAVEWSSIVDTLHTDFSQNKLQLPTHDQCQKIRAHFQSAMDARASRDLYSKIIGYTAIVICSVTALSLLLPKKFNKANVVAAIGLIASVFFGAWFALRQTEDFELMRAFYNSLNQSGELQNGAIVFDQAASVIKQGCLPPQSCVDANWQSYSLLSAAIMRKCYKTAILAAMLYQDEGEKKQDLLEAYAYIQEEQGINLLKKFGANPDDIDETVINKAGELLNITACKYFLSLEKNDSWMIDCAVKNATNSDRVKITTLLKECALNWEPVKDKPQELKSHLKDKGFALSDRHAMKLSQILVGVA